jgi:hypothetical protein
MEALSEFVLQAFVWLVLIAYLSGHSASSSSSGFQFDSSARAS